MPHIAKRRSLAAQYGYYYRLEGIIIAVAVFLILFIGNYFSYLNALNERKRDVYEEMLTIASMASQLVDGDLHTHFTSSEQEDDVAYKKAIAPLKRLVGGRQHISYIYTAVLKNDRVHFVLDPTPEGRFNKNGVDEKAHIMERYTTPPAEMIRALKEQKPTVDKAPFTDKWGTYLSVYAPFYDSHKKFVGIIGVDLEVTRYNEYLKPIEEARWKAVQRSFLIALGWGFGIWLLRLLTARFCGYLEKRMGIKP